MSIWEGGPNGSEYMGGGVQTTVSIWEGGPNDSEYMGGGSKRFLLLKHTRESSKRTQSLIFRTRLGKVLHTLFTVFQNFQS